MMEPVRSFVRVPFVLRMQEEKRKTGSSTVFKTGAVCLAFLLIGFQAALFVHRAAVLRIEERTDRPDTIYVVDEAVAERLVLSSGRVVPDGTEAGVSRQDGSRGVAVRRDAVHSAAVAAVRENRRKVESFPFDPNTAGVEELRRLGFSQKQAESIENYRRKGGRFRRKEDFARSYVVADSVYRRLEPFIRIPRTDINKADSASFDALPGIGPWFAARMVAYRQELGGYSYPEQLMDIYRFDREKYDALKDLISCSPPRPLRLWSLPADSLRRHPYIRSWQAAKAIVLYREHTPPDLRNVRALGEAGILPDSLAEKLSRCFIE